MQQTIRHLRYRIRPRNKQFIFHSIHSIFPQRFWRIQIQPLKHPNHRSTQRDHRGFHHGLQKERQCSHRPERILENRAVKNQVEARRGDWSEGELELLEETFAVGGSRAAFGWSFGQALSRKKKWHQGSRKPTQKLCPHWSSLKIMWSLQCHFFSCWKYWCLVRWSLQKPEYEQWKMGQLWRSQRSKFGWLVVSSKAQRLPNNRTTNCEQEQPLTTSLIP